MADLRIGVRGVHATRLAVPARLQEPGHAPIQLRLTVELTVSAPYRKRRPARSWIVQVHPKNCFTFYSTICASEYYYCEDNNSELITIACNPSCLCFRVATFSSGPLADRFTYIHVGRHLSQQLLLVKPMTNCNALFNTATNGCCVDNC